jgi:23S rRNA (uracil1939-C5)-methyltransferase
MSGDPDDSTDTPSKDGAESAERCSSKIASASESTGLPPVSEPVDAGDEDVVFGEAVYTVGEAVYGGNFVVQPVGNPAMDHARLQTTAPFVLPGEHVALPLPGIDDLPQILDAAAARAQPQCQHFGACGGCHYQHADYAEQLLLKQHILRELFAKAGLAIPEPQLVAGEPWTYRNRIRLRMEGARADASASSSDQQAAPAHRVGYNRRGSHTLLPIADCPISAPLLLRAAFALTTLGQKRASLAPKSPSLLDDIAEVELLTDERESRLQLSLFVRIERLWAVPALRQASRKDAAASRESNRDSTQSASKPAGQNTNPAANSNAPHTQPSKPLESPLATLATTLAETIPELAGAGAYLLPRGDRRNATPRLLSSWGSDGLTMHAGGRSYWTSRGGFFQANRHLTGELVRLVLGERRGTLAWDLYAGAGLFTLPLTERFTRVVGVEGAPTGAQDLARGLARLPAQVELHEAAGTRRAKSRNPAPLHQAHAVSTLAFLQRAVLDRDRPELIVLDPPRAGLGPEVCALLSRIAAPELVYVSCDPESLVRDLRAMVDSGYDVAEVSIVDLFPQTFHMETVAVLRRTQAPRLR